MYWHQGCANTGTISIQRAGAKVRIHISKIIPQKYFPVFAFMRIQAPHVFVQKLIPQEFFSACIGFVPGGILLGSPESLLSDSLTDPFLDTQQQQLKFLSLWSIYKVPKSITWWHRTRSDACIGLYRNRFWQWERKSQRKRIASQRRFSAMHIALQKSLVQGLNFSIESCLDHFALEIQGFDTFCSDFKARLFLSAWNLLIHIVWRESTSHHRLAPHDLANLVCNSVRSEARKGARDKGERKHRGQNAHPKSRNTKKHRIYTKFFGKFVPTFPLFPWVRNPKRLFR